MTILGIGPKLFCTTAALAAPLFAFHYWYYPLFAIQAGPRWLLPTVGSFLIAMGLPFWIVGVRAMRKRFNERVLATDGMYRVCRHPLYALWIAVFLPGILAFFRSWLLFAVPVITYAVFRVLIRHEETWLEEEFGQEYVDYKKRVNALFPTFQARDDTQEEQP